MKYENVLKRETWDGCCQLKNLEFIEIERQLHARNNKVVDYQGCEWEMLERILEEENIIGKVSQ